MIKTSTLPSKFQKNPLLQERLLNLQGPFLQKSHFEFKEIKKGSEIYCADLLTEESCKQIISIIRNEGKDAWKKSGVIFGETVLNETNGAPFCKSDKIHFQDFSKKLLNNFRNFSYHILHNEVHRIWNWRPNGYDSPGVVYYKPSDYYQLHHDTYAGGAMKNRKITFICFLSNTEEGGELHFPNQKVMLPIKAGFGVFFPSGNTHPHESKTVIRGEKYALISWFV